MKIYLALAIASVAIGLWLGARVPADQLPADLVRFDERQDNTIVVRLDAARHDVVRAAELGARGG